MATKQIRLKLTLKSISDDYSGGAEALFNDIKNTGLELGSYTPNGGNKAYYLYTYIYKNSVRYICDSGDVASISQIKTLTVKLDTDVKPIEPIDFSPKSVTSKRIAVTKNAVQDEQPEIATLDVDFLELDESIYNMPDNATISDDIEITFGEIVTHTITFTNTTYSQFDFEFPESMTVEEGKSVELPYASGRFEDDDNVYVPESWDIGENIGEFGQTITPMQDITANLICTVTPKVPLEPIDVVAAFGSSVEIPAGYTVESVKSTYAWCFPDYYFNDSNSMHVSFLGENLYCTDTDVSLLGKNNPCLDISVYRNDSIQNYGLSGGNYPFVLAVTSSSRVNNLLALNSSNYFCVFRTAFDDYTLSGTTYRGTTIATNIALQFDRTYAAKFIRRDNNGDIIEYYFNVPNTLWQFQNGEFVWLGNSSSSSDLAYFYNYKSIKIHCVPA